MFLEQEKDLEQRVPLRWLAKTGVFAIVRR